MRQDVKIFINYLTVERGLSENTCSSYGLDLASFINYLSRNKIDTFENVSKKAIVDYLVYLQGLDRAPATIARQLATIKSFYRFRIQEELQEQNPTEGLETPKLGRHLPKVLSQGEIEKLLNQPEMTKPG